MFHKFMKVKNVGELARRRAIADSGRVSRRNKRDEGAVARFIERFAAALMEAGFPRMPARVFVALLVADEGRRTAAELAELLRVSPAAISGAVRYLTQVGLLSREREPGERFDYYRVHADMWHEAVVRRDAILVRWERDLYEGIEALGPDSPAGARLDETRRFFVFIRGELLRLMSKWQKLRSRAD